MKTREEQIEQNFQNIKNGSLIFAWDFDPYDTPFIVVAKKENDKIYAQKKETNSGAIVLDGYRKQSDTVREFVERLFAKIRPMYFSLIGRNVGEIIDELAKEYGVECRYLVQLIEYMRGQGADSISNPKTGEKWTFGKEK